MEKFIDVSYHKGYMNMQKVKDAGYDAVILKTSDGFFMPKDMSYPITWEGHEDPTFSLYWKQLKELFRWRGCYHFLRVDDEVAEYNGRPTSYEQIPMFHSIVEREGLEWDDYIILDIEQVPEQLDYLDGNQIAERVQDAISATEGLFNRKPIIYTGAWWWEYYHQYFDTQFMYQYPFWLSHYWPIDSNNDIKYSGSYYYEYPNRAFPEAWENTLEDRLAYCRLPMINNDKAGTPSIDEMKVWMWQYTSSGKVPGASRLIEGELTANIDTNYYMYNSMDLHWDIAREDKPVPPPPPPPPPPPVEPPDKPVGCISILNNLLAILKGLGSLFTKTESEQ